MSDSIKARKAVSAAFKKSGGPTPALRELMALDRPRERLFECLRRFVRVEDNVLSDTDLVNAVVKRWLADRGEHIGDVGDGVDLRDLFPDRIKTD